MTTVQKSTRKRGRPVSTEKDVDTGGTVRSLSRAIDLLDDVARYPEGATLGDLAMRAELPPSTAHRLLKGLEARRYVQQDADRGLWFIGVGAFAVGASFLRTRDFVAIARPFMRAAMEETNESVNLAIRDGMKAVYLSQIECRQMMRALAQAGASVPLHASGVGKALLTGLKNDDGESIIRQLDFPKLTDRTITDPGVLEADIARARERGYAIDDQEHAIGLRCAAAPFYNEFSEPVAAVSISGPLARIDDARLRKIGEIIARTAREITLACGGREPER